MGEGRAAPDVVSPPPGNPRFPLFDSLRAIAVVAVVVFHTTGASMAYEAWYGPVVDHLDIGVTIFFLISGFLLYRPFVAARSGLGPRISTADYGWRRFLRILPAYWLALILLSIYPGLEGPFSGEAWKFFGLFQVYGPISHYAPACLQPPYNCGIAPTWSLAVEVSFYALLPVWAVLMARRARRSRGVRGELFMLAALSLLSAAAVAWAWHHVGARYLVQTVAGTFLWFALGMGLAIASVELDGRARRRPRSLELLCDRPELAWAGAIAIYLAISIFVLPSSLIGIDPGFSGPLIRYFGWGAAAFLLLLPAVFEGSRAGLPRRILSNRLLAWVGLVSYGIFLWHFPITYKLASVIHWPSGLRFVGLTAAVLAVSTACAAASYYLVERPLLRLKNRPPWRAALRRRPLRSAG